MSSGPSGVVRRRPTSWSSSRRWARLAGGVLLVGSLVVTVPLVPHGARAEAPAPGGTGSEVDQALAQAADTGQPVIIESATTADVIEYAQPNGTITTQLSAGLVRAPDPGTPGRWVPIDTTLVSDAAGIHPRVADAEITLSAGGAGQLASVTSNGITTGMGWPASLPEPSLTGSTATYANAVDDADLILTALPDGYEVSLILRHAPAEPVTLDLPLATGGLMPSMVNGRLSLADASGAEIVSADPAVMFDSSMDEVGEPKRLGLVSTSWSPRKMGTR